MSGYTGTMTVEPTLAMTLPNATQAVTAARRSLEGLAPWLEPTSYEDLRLLVSELVTNSIRHGDGAAGRPIEVEVRVSGGAVRVAVMDPGAGMPAPAARRDPMEPGGWGLYLVDRIAERWGVQHDKGTTVWFELGQDSASASFN